MTRLILASGSAARRQLLQAAGLRVDATRPTIDEAALKHQLFSQRPDLSPQQLAAELAAAKALSVSRHAPEALVIGGDQVLSLAGRHFDKPASVAEAREHLMALRAKTHHLETALAVAQDGKIIWHHLERPALSMRGFSETFLQAYLEAMGETACETVGGYKLEGLGIQLFEKIEGDYFAILGLPLLPLLQFLRSQNIDGLSA